MQGDHVALGLDRLQLLSQCGLLRPQLVEMMLHHRLDRLAALTNCGDVAVDLDGDLVESFLRDGAIDRYFLLPLCPSRMVTPSILDQPLRLRQIFSHAM